MSALVLASLFLGFAPRQGEAVVPRDVIVVSERVLSDPVQKTIREGTIAGRDTVVPDVGTFRRFETEDHLLAIPDGFLLETRYTRSEKALKRLAEIWRPGSVIKLEGEENLRIWLASFGPPDPKGKAANDASVFRLVVGPMTTFQNGTRRLTTFGVPMETQSREEWPMPTEKRPPREGDDTFMVGLPASMVASPQERYDLKEYFERLRLISLTLDTWHKERGARLRKAAAVFFARVDENLVERFGGSLPIGRTLASLGEENREMLIREVKAQPRQFGFASERDALAWFAGAKIVAVEPQLFAVLPKLDPAGRFTIAYPVLLP